MRALSLLICGAIFFLLASCNGSGGGGGAVAPPGTGTVAVLVQDAPVENLESLEVTITRATLLGGDEEVVLFEGERRVDLLQFQDQEFMLALKDVPADTYDKIRLRVRDPEIEPNPDNYPVIIPGNGKLDLNPREEIVLNPGDSIAVRLDVDAKRSVHVVQTGNGRFIVRPVIFIRVERDFQRPIPLADFYGEVLERNLDEGTLQVLLDQGAGEVEVRVNDDTTIFDEEVVSTDLSVIDVGDRVCVRGRLVRGHVRARVIFEGDPLGLRGNLPDGIDPDPFPFDIDPGQPLSGSVDGTLVDGGRAFIENGREIDPANIPDGVDARLTGRYFLNESLYRVGLIDVEVSRFEGEVEIVDLGAMPPRFTIRDENDVLTTFAIGDDTIFRLVGDGEVPLEFLMSGLDVQVAASGELDGLPLAQIVRIDPLVYEGEVVGVDVPNRVVEIAPAGGGANLDLNIRDDARILLLLPGGEMMEIELGEVMPGDEVEAYGLVDGNADIQIWALIVDQM